MKNFKSIGFFILILVVVIGGLYMLSDEQKPKEMGYSQLITQIQAGNVKRIDFDGQTARVEFSAAVDGKTKWNIMVDPNSSDAFTNTMTDYIKQGKLGEESFFNINKPFSLLQLVAYLPYVLMLVLFFFIWMSFMNNSQGGGASKALSFGRSRAKMSTESDKKTTFNDVAGAKEEKEELEEIVDFLKNPKRFIDIGGRIPKGVLLVGPPGTGKTLLAKAVAGEAKVPFFSLSGSDFVEMFVGVGASRVRDLFEQAKKNAPSIVFIDEIDAVGRHRGAGLGGGHDEREQTLNQLLVEMDGFGVNEGVIVMAATNRADILDPALLRPGRFDRKIYIGRPDIKGREEILKVHSRNKKLASDVDLHDIAKTTPGFTGADLENLLNEAALIAARKNKFEINMEDIKEANYKVMLGPEKKSRVMTDKDKKITAIHEAGHALAVKLLSTTQKVDRVSIISVGQAGGYTAYKPEEDKSYETKGQLIEYIMISLAGMAAEEIQLNEKTTGAYSDLQSANSIARNMVTRYGMSEKLGPLIFGDDKEEVFIGRDFGHTRNYSESFAAEIDYEVKSIIDDAYSKVREALKENRNALIRVSDKLIEKEKLSSEEFEEAFKGEGTIIEE